MQFLKTSVLKREDRINWTCTALGIVLMFGFRILRSILLSGLSCQIQEHCTFRDSEYRHSSSLKKASHLQNLRVVINPTLVATFSCRAGTLREVAALVQEEQSFSVFFF